VPGLREAPEATASAAAGILSLIGVQNPSKPALSVLARTLVSDRAIADRGATLTDYLSALRPQHWLKNLLVFASLMAAHRFIEPLSLARTCVEFLAFSCCASSAYLINDLCDLQDDRQHPQKRLRAFASGRLPVTYALTMAPVLAVLGFVLAALLSPLSLAVVLIYFALTLGYSLVFRRVVLLDVLVLAVLYTLRIIGGAVAISSWPAVYLVAFSMFLFISLAFIKRYAELMTMRAAVGERATARGYQLSDAELLVSKGTASGYVAVLALALYIASGTINVPFSRHQLLWLVCPLLLYWMGHLWLIAHREKMHHDPLVFAVRDRTSRVLVLLMLTTVFVAL
jgi:4-hydroxybenzoate polyprenyltransferase